MRNTAVKSMIPHYLFSILLFILLSCSKSVNSTESEPYTGEQPIIGRINISSDKDSIRYNDTFAITITLPTQKYRIKGDLKVYDGRLRDSCLFLLSPQNVYIEDHFNPSDSTLYQGSKIIMKFDLYPNQAFSQTFVFRSDSLALFNSIISTRNSIVFWENQFILDSILLDMDTIYNPRINQARAVPEKRWYNCSNHSNNPDRKILQNLMFSFPFWTYNGTFYVYFKKQ